MAWKSVRQLHTRGSVSAVSDAVIQQAESQIEGCEHCDTSSDVPFRSMLKCFLTDRSAKRLSLERPPKCPRCQSVLAEQSLVSWD